VVPLEKAVMSKNTSIILGDHFDNFIKEEIKSGRYASTSEIIRSGLRLLELEKDKIKAINKALVDGEKSGKPTPFNNAKFIARMKKKHNIDA
jgi:antitoxin ParD1/3/4